MQISLITKKIYPKNNCQEPHITIGEQHPAYDKLLQGYDFEIINNEIKVKNIKSGIDYKDLKNKLKQGKANNAEVQQILADLI